MNNFLFFFIQQTFHHYVSLFQDHKDEIVLKADRLSNSLSLLLQAKYKIVWYFLNTHEYTVVVFLNIRSYFLEQVYCCHSYISGISGNIKI